MSFTALCCNIVFKTLIMETRIMINTFFERSECLMPTLLERDAICHCKYFGLLQSNKRTVTQTIVGTAKCQTARLKDAHCHSITKICMNNIKYFREKGVKDLISILENHCPSFAKTFFGNDDVESSSEEKQHNDESDSDEAAAEIQHTLSTIRRKHATKVIDYDSVRSKTRFALQTNLWRKA